MADPKTDPVAVLRRYLEDCTDAKLHDAGVVALQAIAELERRQRIERRLDRHCADECWLYLDVSGILYDANGVIEPRVYRAQIINDIDELSEDAMSEGPDRWTAIGRALNAADAPDGEAVRGG